MNRTKVQPTHLGRNAYVYVRQSTQHQVRDHKESTERQYELTDRARDLGWTPNQIVVIDEDLGTSARAHCERKGFERLVSEVALGRAGMVLGLEVSRLARNNHDWYRLLDLCSAFATLIGDGDGIYDPSDYNDRLLLGLKGTMSEAELHVLKTRMQEGLRHKAAKGELRFRLPIGFEHVGGLIVKTSNEEVAHHVELVFAKMLEVGSVSGVFKFLQHEGLRLPRRSLSGENLVWRRPYYRAIYTMLTNPMYAGTYAYGRTEVVAVADATGGLRRRRRRKPIAEWDVVLHDHHAAYVSRDEQAKVRRMIEDNRPLRVEGTPSALREGASLLQGLVRCGKCGRSMSVRYQSRRGKVVSPTYLCDGAVKQQGGSVCQGLGGGRVDQRVAELFADVFSQGKLEIHLEALRQLNEKKDTALEQLELQLERLRYEASRIERQYNAVEPENRVVARTLETRWNEALEQTVELEERVERRRRQLSLRLSAKEERELAELTEDLPRLWAHASVSDLDRKALLRTVLEEVQLLKREREVFIKIVWKGGAITETSVTLRAIGSSTPAPADLIELIRKLATGHTDPQIARVLVRRRIKTPKKQLSFTAHHVASLRRNHNIPCYLASASKYEPDTYTAEQAAKLMSVTPPTIYSWLKLGLLEGDQLAPGAPWVIRITDADRERFYTLCPPGWLPVKAAAQELGVSPQTILDLVKAKKLSWVYLTRGRGRSGLRIDVESNDARQQRRLLD